MSKSAEKNWFGVRVIFLLGQKRRTNVFEEQVCVFSARDAEEAMEKAEREAGVYSRVGPFVFHRHITSYLQDGDELIDGYEVWSELFEFDGSLDDFVEQRYHRFEYELDWDDMPRPLQLVPLLDPLLLSLL